jgi:hypothetical protein
VKPTVTLSIRQFKALHQVFKEIPNLSGVEFPAELSREVLDEARSVTRSVRLATDESATSKVVFTTGDRQEAAEPSPVVERDEETVIVRASAIAAQLSLWPAIVDFITRMLGETETYLRTGYSTTEIQSTAQHLAEEVQGLHQQSRMPLGASGDGGAPGNRAVI